LVILPLFLPALAPKEILSLKIPVKELRDNQKHSDIVSKMRIISLSLRMALILTAIVAPLSGWAQTVAVIGTKFASDFPVTFIADANPHLLLDVSGSKGTALIFMGTDCPIARRYVNEIGAIHRQYFPQGIRVVAVYSNAGTTLQGAIKQVGMGPMRGMPVLMDLNQSLADAVGATMTPEAVVLDKDFILRYRGRIDDGFAARGQDRTAGASRRDLREALTALVAGKPVTVASVGAVGCAIERAKVKPLPAVAGSPAAKTAVANSTDPPTYAADIEPILQKNCIACHREGEIAPMSLLTYEDTKRWAANIAEVTTSKFMPPWKPVGERGRFVGDRRLTDAQIATLKRWADAGAPPGTVKISDVKSGEGDRNNRTTESSSGWRLGKPDLILKMPEKWRVEPVAGDTYRCFVLPTGLTQDRQVIAVEYRAGSPKVVHHIAGFIDTSGSARKRDASDEGSGYARFGSPGFSPAGELGGWMPGDRPTPLPPGIARLLPAHSDVVLQIHYHTDGHPAEDVTQIGLYFAKKPVARRLRTLPVVVRSLDIPAGDPAYTVTQTMTLPLDMEVISLTPHMHLLGKSFEMSAVLPDGSALPLIKITDWDYRWQGAYFLREPIRLPRGSKITLKATYDNSDDNPRNPNRPAKRVVLGEEMTEEMGAGFVGFVAMYENHPALGQINNVVNVPNRNEAVR
jgi:hypothetical protein